MVWLRADNSGGGLRAGNSGGGLERVTVAGCCEHLNKIPGSIKLGNFFTS